MQQHQLNGGDIYFADSLRVNNTIETMCFVFSFGLMPSKKRNTVKSNRSIESYLLKPKEKEEDSSQSNEVNKNCENWQTQNDTKWDTSASNINKAFRKRKSTQAKIEEAHIKKSSL